MRVYDESGLNLVRGSFDAAGYDLVANHPFTLEQGESTLVGTGLRVEFPSGCYGKIEARSGLAVRDGVQVLAGVIDPDYRGEIKVALTTIKREQKQYEKGERIAQLIIIPFLSPPIERVEFIDDLTRTVRQEGGFGSTGR